MILNIWKERGDMQSLLAQQSSVSCLLLNAHQGSVPCLLSAALLFFLLVLERLLDGLIDDVGSSSPNAP
jgi:hypothetical protein